MFKVGDKVNIGFSTTDHTIKERCPCNDISCDSWVLDDGSIFDDSMLRFASNKYSVPSQGTYNVIRPDGSVGTIKMPEGISVDLKSLKDQAVYKTECKHSWRSYFGLNERFDFCTVCDKKRGHL